MTDLPKRGPGELIVALRTRALMLTGAQFERDATALMMCEAANMIQHFADREVALQSAPPVGQHGKDVPWVPSQPYLIERMLDLADVGPQDIFVDLGCGDGRALIAAAKRGARSYGVDYNPQMVTLANQRAAEAAVKIHVKQGDLFKYDFADASVLWLFLLPKLLTRLEPLLVHLRPGTRIISNSFILKTWPAAGTFVSNERAVGMLYVVP